MSKRFNRLLAMLLALTLLGSTLPATVFAASCNQPPNIIEFLDPVAPGAPVELPSEESVTPPAAEPSDKPTAEPTEAPTAEPTAEPTEAPTAEPAEVPTQSPTQAPTTVPTQAPTAAPADEPADEPTNAPSLPWVADPHQPLNFDGLQRRGGKNPDVESVEWTSADMKDEQPYTLTAKDYPSLSSTTYVNVTSVSNFQSKHPYDNYTDKTWVYTVPNASYIAFSVSSDTLVETNYDYLFLYNADDEMLGYVTGNTLNNGETFSGNSWIISGDTIKIRLVSDYSVTRYGFRITECAGLVTEDLVASYAVSSLVIRLTLPAVTGLADGYEVYRATAKDGPYQLAGRTTATEFTTDAVFGQLNYFKIRAYTTDGYYGNYSNYRSQYCLATPTLYQPTVNGTAVSLSFKTIANANAYRVYLATSPNSFNYQDYVLISANGSDVQYSTLNGLAANTTYYVRMRAQITINGVTYVGPYGGVRSVRTGAGSGSGTAQSTIGSAPEMGPATVLSSTSLKITWSSVPGAARYELYRSAAYNGSYSLIATTTALEYTDNNPLFGQVNYYKVRAVIQNSILGSGYSPMSGYRSTLGLSTPGIQALSAAATGVNVQFGTVAIANGYYIARSDSANGTFSRIGTLTCASGNGGGQMTYTDITATPGSTYYYRVQAYYDNPVNGTRYVGPFGVAKPITLTSTSTQTTYRAYMVVQHDHESDHIMYRDDNIAMQNMLNGLGGTQYQLTIRADQTANQILSGLTSTFANATENDVSLFFFSSHGSSSGYLSCYNNTYLNADMLRRTLDTIPGKKVLIICACYSGNLIGKDAEATADAWAKGINNSFIDTFSRADRANLAAPNYYVITSASSRETSFSRIYDNSGYERHKISILALVLAKGCGWYYPNGACRMYADTNNDGRITLHEAHTYAYSEALSTLGGGNYQYVQVYPDNSSFPIFID